MLQLKDIISKIYPTQDISEITRLLEKHKLDLLLI